MNKIIPFHKEIKFNDMIGEIISIALDNNLEFIDSYTISGDLIVRGTNKIGDIEEDFSYSIPTSISVDDKYDTSKSKIMVDDFYYEIVNDDILKLKIDLILDDLSFKEQEIEPVIETVDYDIRENDQVEEEKEEEKDLVSDLFKETNPEKDYSIYRVYVVVEGDTLSKILEKYNITSEELSHYNDIDNIKPGTKLIIPSVDE